MSIIISVLISITVNMDNFIIGIMISQNHEKLKNSHNSIISAITGLFTTVTAFFACRVSKEFISFSSYIGAGMMILFGLYCLFTMEANTISEEKVCALGIRKSILLGVILGINCLPPAFAGGILGLSPLFLGISAFVTSFLSLKISGFMTSLLRGSKRAKCLNILSCVLFIVIGLFGLVL